MQLKVKAIDYIIWMKQTKTAIKIRLFDNNRSNSNFKENEVEPVNLNDAIPPLVRVFKLTSKDHTFSTPVQSLSGSHVESQYMYELKEPLPSPGDNFFHSPHLPFQEPLQNHIQLPFQPLQETFIQPERAPSTAVIQFDQRLDNNQPLLDQKEPIIQQPSPLYSSFLTNYALKLFGEVVHKNVSLSNVEQIQHLALNQMGWLFKKSSPELLSAILSSPQKMEIYLKHLLQTVHSNRKNKRDNQIHQENTYLIDKNVQEYYSLLSCILINFTNINVSVTKNLSKSISSPEVKSIKSEVFISEAAVKIDFDSHSKRIKSSNNNKIKQLKQKIEKKDAYLINMKAYYDEIISNYACSLQNLSKFEDFRREKEIFNESSRSQSKKQSKRESKKYNFDAALDQMNEQGQIRGKNHTFGGK